MIKSLYSSLVLAGAAALLLGGGRGAFADANFVFTGAGNSKVVTMTGIGGVYAGQYKATLNGAPINIFCVDFSHEIHSGDSYTADTNFLITAPAGPRDGAYYDGGLSSALIPADYHPGGALSDATRAGAVSYLADAYLGLDPSTFTFGNGYDFNTNMAAISLSIWDLVQDGGGGLHAGAVQAATADYDSLVSGYEADALSAAQNDRITHAFWLQAPRDAKGNHIQEYVYEDSTRTGHTLPVPEPGAVSFLGSLGLVVSGLALRLRRRRACGC